MLFQITRECYFLEDMPFQNKIYDKYSENILHGSITNNDDNDSH